MGFTLVFIIGCQWNCTLMLSILVCVYHEQSCLDKAHEPSTELLIGLFMCVSLPLLCPAPSLCVFVCVRSPLEVCSPKICCAQ